MARKWKFTEKFSYDFGRFISKGTGSFAVVLLAITGISVLVSTILLTVTRSDTPVSQDIADSVVYTLSPSNIWGGTYTDLGTFFALLIVGLCGLFVTSTLVALIVAGVQSKLADQRKGHSKVAENGHTVVLGYNDKTFTIVSELILANKNGEKRTTVVGGDHDKTDMQETLKRELPDYGNMRVVCRSGVITDPALYDRCSLETCRTMIVAGKDDSVTIKAILGIVSYLKEHDAISPDRRICVLVNNADNFQAALLAGEGSVDLLYVQDNVGHILAQTCHQPGLSRVYSEVFSFDGDEIYFDELPQLVGHRFIDILPMFSKGVALGICRGEDTILNPRADEVIEPGDKIMLLENSAGCQVPDLQATLPDASGLDIHHVNRHDIDHLLILGCNEMLPSILSDLSRYTDEPIRVTVATRHDTSFIDPADYAKLDLSIEHGDPLGRKVLDELTTQDYDHVLTLSDYTDDPEGADARTLLQLIHLRDINSQRESHFKITSEMRTPNNERLARVSDARDFVIGTRVISTMLVQLSYNHLAWKLFDELLAPEGSEFAVVPATDYLPCEGDVDFAFVTAAVAAHREIAVGYERVDGDKIDVILNPDKSQRFELRPQDALVVLSETMQQ